MAEARESAAEENLRSAYSLTWISRFDNYHDGLVDWLIAWCTEHWSVRRSDSAAVRRAMTAHSMFDDQSLSYYGHVTRAAIDILHATEHSVHDHPLGSVRVSVLSCGIWRCDVALVH